jgi:hypothetical protein
MFLIMAFPDHCFQQDMCTKCDVHSNEYDSVEQNFQKGSSTTKEEIQQLLDDARERGVWPGCEDLVGDHPRYFDDEGNFM